MKKPMDDDLRSALQSIAELTVALHKERARSLRLQQLLQVLAGASVMGEEAAPGYLDRRIEQATR